MSCYVGLDPAATLYPQRYQEYQLCPKIFEILATKSYPICPLTLRKKNAGPRCAVGNVSGYICVSDCRSRDREFDPGPVPYFRGD